MVSSWAENSPVATTCRSRGQAVLRAARKAARKYADPASLKNPYASSSRVNPATVLTQNVIRDVQFWAHQAFYSRAAPHHHGSGEKARPLSHAANPSHHHGSGETHRRRYASPDLSTAPFRDASPSCSTPFERTCRAHSQAPQPALPLMGRSLSTDGQITHLAPSRCSMTAWAAAKRAIGTRNGEQET